MSINKTKIHLTTTYLFLSQKFITYTKLEQAQITVHSHTFGRIIQLVFLNGFSKAKLKSKKEFLPILNISLPI